MRALDDTCLVCLQMKQSVFVTGAVAGAVALAFGLFVAVSSVQETSYMDEVFHIPQAQRYCEHNFSYWDPKLTTLPGLYFISIAILEPAAAMIGSNSPVPLCTVTSLRFHSLIIWLGVIVLLNRIQTCLHGSDVTVMSALVLAHFPLLYFFAFFYYTDVVSTFFVLLTYLLALKKRCWSSAMAGAMAILCRQTNVVWVGFSAAVALLRDTELKVEEDVKKKRDGSTSDFEFFKMMVMKIASGIQRVAFLFFPYGIVLALFLLFVYLNKGIVVGDRSSHVASLHLMQMFYFYLFALAMGFPHFANWDNMKAAWRCMSRVGIRLLLIIPLCSSLLFLAIKRYTIVHPYLRDDNRHFTFYIWRKLFARYKLMKYTWIPVYLLAIALIHVRAGGAKYRVGTWLWQAGFLVCTAVCVVPQQLVEFRYFIIPYLLLRLHLRQVSGWSLFFEFVLYAGLNAAVFVLFMLWPFRWQHEPEQLQRFMW